LENVAAYDFYRNTIEHLQRILDIAPEIVAYDLHPDYLSTQFAQEERSIPKVGVQHHHAHIVSCMAENHISGPLIGLALDGTGYGSDGKIWGGEVLIADEIRSERAAHIAYTCMPGSAAAIRAPWRMAVSYLDACFGNAFRQLDLPLLKRVSSKKVTIVQEMMRRQINAPETSSLGRLFDGVAAIIGLRMEVSYEGQAAMELEMLADKAVSKGYDYQWTEDQPKRLLPQPIIQGVATDVLAGLPLPVISAKFHDTLVDAFTDICEALRREERLQRVALSGGVFQNKRLLEGLLQRLEQKGFQVFTHRRVPTNDGGIALGQAVVAAISHK
jgi:hydrogenase maturation protein HypF